MAVHSIKESHRTGLDQIHEVFYLILIFFSLLLFFFLYLSFIFKIDNFKILIDFEMKFWFFALFFF